jgi:hypothetical protein
VTQQERSERLISVQTTAGRVEGSLRIAARLRTLDDLNLVSKNLVALRSARPDDETWSFSEGELSIHKASIVFVHELDAPSVQSGVSFGRFTRSAVRLKVGAFDIQGFVHVPPGGVAIKRLDQGNHPFVSLTSVLVSGPDGEFTAPFLAVNRNHIIAAQEAQQPADSEEEALELAATAS